ncbi:MAG: peptide deformylase [Bacillota bacterium]|nr:peptide deformylase [Bacillota bacterium]
MAIRNIRKYPDEILNKKSREVRIFDDKLHTLLDDMKETMYQANGAGLAAVQVGILKRVVVVDDGNGLIELINPVIVLEEGEQVGPEGCLSFPGKWGEVARPNHVKVKAKDRNGKVVYYEGEGLLARAFCHELEHLDGKNFTMKVIRYYDAEDQE